MHKIHIQVIIMSEKKPCSRHVYGEQEQDTSLLFPDAFWRILYYKKYPEVPRINHEYIIVAKK